MVPLLTHVLPLPGPILYCMELAVVLAGGLRDWIDFGVIIGILMMNAFVGWYQEKQAGDIVAQLKAGIALHSVVVRNGQEIELEAREIVPGDIVRSCAYVLCSDFGAYAQKPGRP
jgi:H+-transporting ATPase